MERFETQRWMSHEVARLIAIFESERRFYDEIVTRLPLPLATVGADGAIRSANQSFLDQFGISRQDLERHSLSAVFGNSAWMSALLPRDPGTLATGNFSVEFIPISRWDRGETEWMAVFVPLHPSQTASGAPATPATVTGQELAANIVAVEAAQRLAGRVTHELNNLVMVAAGYGREIQNQLSPDSPLRADLSMVLGATERMEVLAAQLNDFSRPARSEISTAPLRDLIPASGYQMMPIPGEIAVATDRAALASVFASLPAAFPAPLSFTLDTTHSMAVVRIAGFGVSAESLRQHFEVLNKAAREDLPGARDCALLGPRLGQAGVQWRVLEPGTLELYIPLAAQVPAQTPRVALVVEDQPGIRAIIRRILENRSFQVIDAGSAEEALSILDRRREAFHLLVTDMRMPGMTGRDLADRVRLRHPDTRILFISGFTDDPGVQSGILPDRARFLAKPFNPEQFVAAVTQLME